VWGQFSIFGAVEENLRCELGGIRGDEKFVEEMRLSRMQGGRSVRWKAAEEDAAQGEDGLSTETAQEMQKGFRLVATGNPRRTPVKVRDPSTSWPLRFCEAATPLTMTVLSVENLPAG
jgi:hypothetical protein